MAVSRDDRDSSDELLAAMGFLDEFQLALSLPSPAFYVDGAGVNDDAADTLGLASLDELGFDGVLAEISTFVTTDSTLEPSPHARHQLLATEPALKGSHQQEREQQQQQSQEHRKRPISNTNTRQTQKRTKRKPSWDPNKARNERKGEIVYLCKQVAELETELAEIKAKTPANSTRMASIIARRPHRDDAVSADGAPAAARQSQLCTVEARAWEEIAKNQLEMRTEAERENIRLKLVLENQLKVAKNLGSHVDRAASSHQYPEAKLMAYLLCFYQEIQRYLPAKQVRLMYPTPSEKDELDATVIVDSLVAGLEQSYAELDAVFETNGLAESETSHINTQMHANNDSLLLEVFATKVLPFDFDATVKAVWNHFEFEKEPILKRVNNATDSIIKNFHLKLQAKGTTANFGVKQVIRRYDEQDRVVIVWRSFFDPIESSCDEPFADVRFFEKGYVVIKKPATIADSSFTLLQPCFIITPIFSEQQNGKGNRHQHQPPLPTGAMADFVFATTVANIRTSHQMIVDALLQQAVMVN